MRRAYPPDPHPRNVTANVVGSLHAQAAGERTPTHRNRHARTLHEPSTIELLDGCVAVNRADGHPGITRSRVVEQAIVEWFELTRTERR